MEGKDAMQNKEFSEFGSGMSSVLRLTTPWAGTPRVMVNIYFWHCSCIYNCLKNLIPFIQYSIVYA